ncbi:MAG: SusC/RagA family TonB-linked outer membrane protein, partial [Cyclobacteriaceae bacterium]
MKKVLLLMAFSMLAFGFAAHAQERSVSGTILSDDDDQGLPGVNVIVKGTTQGTTSDLDGNYKITVPSSESVLVFSSIGFANQEVTVGDQTSINVSLASDVTQLGEVVVTALGVERDKRSLGFSSQQVNAKDLRVARESNVNAALAGKVSGVQIVSGSGAKFGTPAIRIRGVRGLASADPLYVLDGMVINDPASINMDNVESINVLKGANAAALYGNRARDGVVMITSKRAKKGALNITFNNTTQIERVATLVDYQNEYGGGYTQEWSQFAFDPGRDDPALSGLNGADIPEFYADESWGPKLDGRQVAQWNAFVPGAEGYGTTRPWSPQPDNVRDYFETGVFVNNSLSVGKADENYSVNATLTNSRRTGVLPGSNQNKTFLNLNSIIDLSDKVKLTALANYSKSDTEGNLFEGYNSIGSNINQWFQRQLDIGFLKRNYQLPDGTFTSWNMNSARDTSPLYWDNPYTYALANQGFRDNETFQGKFGLEYEVIDGLVLGASLNRNVDHWTVESITASGTLDLDAFGTSASNLIEDNYEFTAKYNKQLNDNFSLSALAGGNIRNYDFDSRNSSTAGGLSVPGLYTIAASVDRPNATTFFAKKSIRSVFGQASVGYKEMLFVDATIRTDWDSALPNGRNAFTYPSVSTSFVFSELLGNQNFLSFGKIRASYAEVGQE